MRVSACRSIMLPIAVCSAMASPAVAQTLEFHISAQPAAKGISDFAKQSGIQLLANSEDVTGKRTNEVKGSYTVEQALALLLRNTGLELATGIGAGEIVTIRATAARPIKLNAVSEQTRQSPSAQPTSRPTIVEPEQDSTIVVTGSRLRSENVQRTPLAVSVVDAEQLERLNSKDISGIAAAAPNILIDTVGTVPGLATISIRGFSSRSSDISIEPGVPVYVDGVYQAAAAGNAADTFDLDKIEVLRGPQGSLLGKNATAGAIVLTRSQPTGKLGAKVQADYGSYDLVKLQSLINFPLVPDVLAGKIFGSFYRRGDWVDNLAISGGDLGGERRGSIRGALLFTPSDSLKLYLTADYIWNRDHQLGGRNVSAANTRSCTVYGYCGAQLNLRRGTTLAGYLAPNKSDENNITAKIDWNIGNVQLTSISGYREYSNNINTDLDQTPAPILHLTDFAVDMRQASQEFRLTSSAGASDPGLSWLVAAYYGYSRADALSGQEVFGAPSIQSQRSIRDSYAVFGHADYNISGSLILSFGARHSWDKTRHLANFSTSGTTPLPFVIDQDVTFENSSFEAGAQYNFSPGKMAYFRFAEGYRGGGFQGLPTSLAASQVIFKPEYATSYEGGVKTEWFDRQLQLNLTLFRTDFKDLQRVVTVAGPTGAFVTVTSNAANVVSQGVEIEGLVRPADALTVRMNLGYLDAKYKRYVTINGTTGQPIDLSGQPLTYAPEFAGSISAEYIADLSRSVFGFDQLSLYGMVSGKSRYQQSLVNHPVGNQPGYATVDASVSLMKADDRYRLSLYVQNLFDKRYLILGDTAGSLLQYQIDNIGRVFGVTASARF